MTDKKNGHEQELQEYETILEAIINTMDPATKSDIKQAVTDILVVVRRHDPLIASLALAIATQTNIKDMEK